MMRLPRFTYRQPTTIDEAVEQHKKLVEKA